MLAANPNSISPTGSILSGVVILAATASIVAASVSRQENLSNRIRLLAQELREIVNLASRGQLTVVERRRLCDLPEQILLFEGRLHSCVRGHIFLYCALAAEAIGFGIGFILALSRELGFSEQGLDTIERLAIIMVSPAFFFAFVLLFVGIGYHIREYLYSNKTISLEMRDIKEYCREIDNHPDEFTERLRGGQAKRAS